MYDLITPSVDNTRINCKLHKNRGSSLEIITIYAKEGKKKFLNRVLCLQKMNIWPRFTSTAKVQYFNPNIESSGGASRFKSSPFPSQERELMENIWFMALCF